MTKKDIQRGDLVLLRDGRVCVIMKDMDDPNKGLTLYGKTNSSMGFFDIGPNKIALGKVAHLFDYYDDLTASVESSSNYDIMAIRKTADLGLKYSVPFIFNTLFNHDDAKANGIFWDWEREEIKEVTMAEVEEKFGCKVKIVKGEDDG